VLSGFLISGLLFTDLKLFGRIRLLRFYARRGMKIYPSFYFFLLTTALLFPRLFPSIRVEAVFLQNYIKLSPFADTAWGHLWSLAVEEHFYLILPLVLIALSRWQRLHFIPYISIGLVIACLVLRIPYCTQQRSDQVFETHLRADALFAGVMLGYFYYRWPDALISKSRWYLLPFTFASLVPVLLFSHNPVVMALSLTTNLIGFSSLVLWAIPRRFKYCGIVAEIGRYSYSIYLWQMILALLWHLRPMTLLGFSGYLGSSLVVGILACVIVEEPALLIRDKLIPARATRYAELKRIVRPVQTDLLA
jgi:peptidoglycan/LPS O-acetylase OafA/YrhL